MSFFAQSLSRSGKVLHRKPAEVLQANLGRYCNMTCSHCHVEAGPTRTESMPGDIARSLIDYLSATGIKKLDLTGGAPELNPHFDYLVETASGQGVRVMDRCNLTVFFEKGKEYLPDFFTRHGVEVVASLPCYSAENVDKQRGRGIFDKSIRALRLLNEKGYGGKDSGLILNLVYNPVGPHLPPDQTKLKEQYRRRLLKDFGIVFNDLFALANMPITRYAKYLTALRQYDAYMRLLIDNYNPNTVEGLMCRETISVAWDGRIFDCDFNLALDMCVLNPETGSPLTIFDLLKGTQIPDDILTGDHCFGCTAGCGSSCGGALEKSSYA